MATSVTTSTAVYATKGGRHIGRTSTGGDWVMHYNLANTRYEFRVSTDGGATWTERTSLRVTVAANRAEYAEFYIGEHNRAVFASCGAGGYQVRFMPNMSTGTAWTLLANNTTQNTKQIGCRVFNYGTLSGVPTFAVVAMENSSTNLLNRSVWQRRVSDSSAFSGPNRQELSNQCSAFDFDFQHNGDGKTAVSGPALYFVHYFNGFARTYFQRRAWNNTNAGWATPSGDVRRTVRAAVQAATDPLCGMFDGTRFVMSGFDDFSTTFPWWAERDAADTANTFRTVPDLSDGDLTSLSLSFDGDGATRLYGVGVTSKNVSRVRFDRAAGTFDAWETLATTTATALTLSVQPGFQSTGAGLVWTSGGSSPYTVTHGLDAFNRAPLASPWAAPATNSAHDVGASLTLDWVFNDPDDGDTQSAYSLRRSVNGGALEYWNAGTQLWAGSEVKNTTSTSVVTLASSWAVDGDTVVFAVKTWDAADEAGPYSSGLTVTGSTPVAPVITVPADAATITTSTLGEVEWTATEQTAYRVRLLTSADAVLYDSGKVTSATKSHSPGFALTTGLTGAKVEVRVWNDDGLEGATDTHTFDVTFVPPATPTLVVTADDANGRISVVVTDPAPSGDPIQPTVTSRDLFVRVAAGGRAVGERTTDTDGIRIAANQLESTLHDYAAPSGVALEYMVRANGDNGTSSDSAWTA